MGRVLLDVFSAAYSAANAPSAPVSAEPSFSAAYSAANIHLPLQEAVRNFSAAYSAANKSRRRGSVGGMLLSRLLGGERCSRSCGSYPGLLSRLLGGELLDPARVVAHVLLSRLLGGELGWVLVKAVG